MLMEHLLEKGPSVKLGFKLASFFCHRKKVKHLMLGKRHRPLPSACNVRVTRGINESLSFLRLTGDPVEPDLEVGPVPA